MIEKKYLVSLFAVVAAMIVCVGTVAVVDTSDAKLVSDDSGICGEGLSYEFDSESKTLTVTGAGDMYSYEKHEKMPWHKYRGEIETIVLSDGITSICDKAFEGCHKLTSISVPASVEKVGKEAFKGCHAVTAIEVLGDNVVIGEKAFEGCKEAASIEIVGGAVEIGKEAFKDNHVASEIYIDCESIVIGERAFADLKEAVDVSISGGSVMICKEAFKNAHKVTSVDIACETVTVCEKAFEGCKEMTSVDFSGSVETTIGKEAFKGCHKLTYVDLCSVTSIGEKAFDGCKEIKTLIVPGSVTEISKHAFKGTYDRIVVYNWSGIDLKNNKEYYGLSKKAIVIDCSACTVTFDANGGELVGDETAKIAYGAKFEFDQTAKPDDKYLGWNTEKDGSGNWIVSGSIWKYTVDKTLYAQWSDEPATQVTVTFDANEGRLNGPSAATATVGQKFAFTQSARWDGHEFIEWNTKQDGTGTKVVSYGVWTIEEDTTLYAQWEIGHYTLAFRDCDDCTWTQAKPTGYTYGDQFALPDGNIVSKEGYEFGGWYETVDFSDEPVTAIKETDFGDKTFHAKWIPLEQQK